MILVLVLAVYAGYLLLDFRPTAHSGNKKVVWPCLILLCIGVVVQVLYELKVNVPSPSTPISAFVSSMFNLK